ncbi:unnamed protein product [Medioppia subpectinata]|uniref:ABC transporter domain-containing protein n=1 Tax=Medioppia subpectinata TaxID=1979941 RepID=A0A7R9KEB2_9ACAR|nr:unnamed protein product [Medioppia subpectinata]CAG2101752.1 unnamed protein product [Medioppia subpectinata]
MFVVLEINPPGAATSNSKLEQVTLPKEIIQNVSGIVMPGQLLAIMGPSGAGKTTLLNSLTGRNLSKMSVTGDVLLNGRLRGRTPPYISSYIQQNEMFYPLLTVREHLMFQATLRLGGKLTYAERAELVENVINKLNMIKCADNRIGSESTFKGISGGEMKRFDEPTSGLDSFMAESIVRLLKYMASEGRTIVCTIHQPSSQVFALFDHLLLMTNGRLAFMGTRDNAKDFFSSIGYLCSINQNPSDYYMNQLALTSNSGSKERVNGICDKYMASEYMTDLLCKIDQSKHQPSQYGNKSPHANQQFGSSPWQQLTTLLMRNYLILIRDTMFIKTELVQFLAYALFIGSVYHKQYPISSDVSNINAGLFMILLQNSMSANPLMCRHRIFCTEMSMA